MKENVSNNALLFMLYEILFMIFFTILFNRIPSLSPNR